MQVILECRRIRIVVCLVAYLTDLLLRLGGSFVPLIFWVRFMYVERRHRNSVSCVFWLCFLGSSTKQASPVRESTKWFPLDPSDRVKMAGQVLLGFPGDSGPRNHLSTLPGDLDRRGSDGITCLVSLPLGKSSIMLTDVPSPMMIVIDDTRVLKNPRSSARHLSK